MELWSKSLVLSKPQNPTKMAVSMARGPQPCAQLEARPSAVGHTGWGYNRGVQYRVVCATLGAFEGGACQCGREGRVQEDFLKEVTPEPSPSQQHLGKGIQASGATTEARARRWDTVMVGEEAPSSSSDGC